MVERFRPKTKKLNGGARPGAGRPKGRLTSLPAIARKKAKTNGTPPHELLCQWAQTGVMRQGNHQVQLTPDQRMSSAKAAAPYYHPQMRYNKPANEGHQPVRVELDLSKLVDIPMDKLGLIREVLLMLNEAGLDSIPELTSSSGGDPDRYRKTLN